jgi:hypothetical protein
MKFLSLLLCLCLSMNTFASTSFQDLERSLDEYHYALTVEWDQKDKDFYNAQTNKFFAAIRASGLSKEDLLSFIEKKTKNKSAVESMKLKAEILSKQADSDTELAEMLRISSGDYYSQGASWTGDTVLIGGIILVLGALIAYGIWWNVKYQCVASERYRDCGWETDRNGERDYVCETKTRCLEWVERH